jgi:hypothetical protein
MKFKKKVSIKKKGSKTKQIAIKKIKDQIKNKNKIKC